MFSGCGWMIVESSIVFYLRRFNSHTDAPTQLVQPALSKTLRCHLRSCERQSSVRNEALSRLADVT